MYTEQFLKNDIFDFLPQFCDSDLQPCHKNKFLIHSASRNGTSLAGKLIVKLILFLAHGLRTLFIK